MFHVEHPHAGLPALWEIGPGDPGLRATALQVSHHLIEMGSIQFGRKIIQKQQWCCRAKLAKHIKLRQEAGQCRELGLPTRKLMAFRCVFESKQPISAMRTPPSVPLFTVMCSMRRQHLDQ